MPLTKEQCEQLYAKLQVVGWKTDRLLLKFVSHPFVREKAREYATQGFARRLQTMRRCIENVFSIIPPDVVDVPQKLQLDDAQINIQAAFANIYGCVDNLAWVWVYERELSIPALRVGLRRQNTDIRASLSPEFRAYLHSLEDWFAYLTEYRDALAHRIPLYIPPGNVRPKDVDAYNDLMTRMNAAIANHQTDEYERLSLEQSKLLVFQPVIGHSLVEMKAPYFFHVQLIADFLTIEELGNKMLAELHQLASDSSC
jgi:hypothetical protein